MQEVNIWLIGGGLGIGALFGLIVQRSRFCVLAAVSNWVFMRDLRHVHGYLAALAVAVIGTAVLEYGGVVAVNESFYRGARIDWLGTLGGGAVFGFGVALAGGCAGRLLVRGAEGSIGAWLAMIALGLGSAACAYGVLAPARVAVSEATAIPTAMGDAAIATLLGLPFWAPPVMLIVIIALVLIAGVRRHASAGMVLAGGLIGLLVVLGWTVTGYLARDDFAPEIFRPSSLAFAGPLAQVIRFIGSGELTSNIFPIALMAGGLLGACFSAVSRGQFRLGVPAPREIGHSILGGGLMGVGAVFAGGCNIGQALTGMSTLSVSALLAVGGMVLGMHLGISWLRRVENARTGEPGRIARVFMPLWTRLYAVPFHRPCGARVSDGWGGV